MLASVLSWSSTSTSLTRRHNQYLGSVSAAEAATERVIAQIARDFQKSGDTGVFNNLSVYRQLVPTVTSAFNNLTNSLLGGSSQPTASSVWSNFEFSDGQQHVNTTYVEQLSAWGFTALQTTLSGLNGNASTYRIVSNARELNASFDSVAAIKQDVQIASIPIFGYEVFYALDLEFCPSSDLAITGPVHGNGTIYCQPDGKTLTFQSPVTSARKVLHQKHPDDPTARASGQVVYKAGRNMRVNTLNLPIGTDNSPSLLHGLIEIPPASESTNSLLAQQRYYNKADLIILVSNNLVVAKSGAYNGFLVSIPWLTISPFVNTNVTFFNKRENETVLTTDIDIQGFRNQYSSLTLLLGRSPKSLYVADLRTQGLNTQPGVRLINGQTLPSAGLTVATLSPLYVKGHYNAPSGSLGTTNTSATVPALLVADAITILSGAWADTNSTSVLNARTANNTTVNAAVIAGIAPTGNGYYSGGVENFFRLLEKWAGDTLTFNGSMVVLFPSQIATAPWGASPEVYIPPTRAYAHDVNFKNASKLPPGTPEVRTLIRAQWAMLPANTVR